MGGSDDSEEKEASRLTLTELDEPGGSMYLAGDAAEAGDVDCAESKRDTDALALGGIIHR